MLLGLGDGTFFGGTLYNTYGSQTINASDINGDGKLDLIIAKESSSGVTTLTGNGDGSFHSISHYPTNATVSDAAVNDFNGDGVADFVVALQYQGAVAIMTGGCAELTITKSHSGNFRGNFNEQYTITVKNTGTAYSSGTITVKDILPSGLTIYDMYGNYPWNCNEQTVTCTTTTAIPGGSESKIYLTVKVSVDAPSSVTNIATVSGGGDVDPNNNTASDPTTIVHVPDLVINKTHSGIYSIGETITYTINVGNNGTGATSGPVTVTDSLPSAFSATAMGGTGWICNVGTRTCTRSDVLSATSAYPPITLTATVVNVYSSQVTNVATVSGGNDSVTSNNTAYDPTTLVIPPTLVTATASSPNTITVNWNAVQAATTYEVWRATSAAGGYAPIATTVSTFYLDRNVTPNTAYLYKVRAIEGSTIGPLSEPDLATTVMFTDDPLLSGTGYKTAHITELRAAVNAVRAAAGMAPASFTDSTLSSGGLFRAVHITDLRSALHAARIALGFSTPSYTDSALAPGYRVKAVHLLELRAYVK